MGDLGPVLVDGGLRPPPGAWAEGPAARFVVDGYPRSAEQLRTGEGPVEAKLEKDGRSNVDP